MKTLFRAVLIYGIASAVVAWFGLLFMTIANLVFALARSISMGVNIFQNFAAGVILILLTILLFAGLKLLFGVAKSGMAMGKAMGAAGRMGMPPGGMGNMLKGLGRLDPRSLRDAGNLADRLGARKAGQTFRKAGDAKSGLDEAAELKRLQGEKSTGKVDKKKQKSLKAGMAKRTKDLDKASRDKDYRDKVKSGMLFDDNNEKKTGEELRAAEMEALKFDQDAQSVAKFRDMFPDLGERLNSDQITRLLDGEMPNYEKRAMGIGDREMNKITDRAEKGHFTDGLGVNTDNDYKKLAEETGGIGAEHKGVDTMDSKEIQEKNSETLENDEKSTEIAERVRESHSSEVDANKDAPGEDTTQKGMDVSQTVNETKNAIVNGSDNVNSPEAIISDPEKEKSIASGAGDLPVDKSVADDNARRTSVEIGNLTSSAPGMPEGTTIDENGESLRNGLLERDANGNVISSVADDEVVRAGETAARGDAIHGTVLPKSVTESGDLSDENIKNTTRASAEDYISGMSDQSVAGALDDRELSSTSSTPVSASEGTNVDDIIGTKESSSSSADYMSALEDADRETVEATRSSTSTAASSLQSADMGTTDTRAGDSTRQDDAVLSDLLGQPATEGDRSVDTEAVTGVVGNRSESSIRDQSVADTSSTRSGMDTSTPSVVDDVLGQPARESGQSSVGDPVVESSAPDNVVGQPVSGSRSQDDLTSVGGPVDSDLSRNNVTDFTDTQTPSGISNDDIISSLDGNVGDPVAANDSAPSTSTQQSQVYGTNSGSSDDMVASSYQNIQQARSEYEKNQQSQSSSRSSEGYQDTSTPVPEQFTQGASSQVNEQVTQDASAPVSEQFTQVNEQVTQDASAPVSEQFTKGMSDPVAAQSGQDTSSNVPNTDQFIGGVAPDSQTPQRENQGSVQDSQVSGQQDNVTGYTDSQQSTGITNEDVLGTVNQETPQYVERPAPQQNVAPSQQDSGSVPVRSQNDFTEQSQRPDGMTKEQYNASGQHVDDRSAGPFQSAPQQDYQSQTGEPNYAPDQYRDAPAPVQGDQQYTTPAPVQGDQQYTTPAPVQDVPAQSQYQDRKDPTPIADQAKQPEGMIRDQFSASGQQASEQNIGSGAVSGDPQQYVNNAPTQQNTSDSIMNAINQDQGQQSVPVQQNYQDNGQVQNAQPVSGGYSNIPQNPLVNNDGFYGDREVRLSPESMALMGMLMNGMDNNRDADLRRDIADMNRSTEDRMVERMDQLSEKFEDDLRESGKYTEDEIRGEVEGMADALRSSMERKDDFSEELDQAKMNTQMTNKGNTGKVTRPENKR